MSPRKSLENFSELGQHEIDREVIRKIPLAFCQRNQVALLQCGPEGALVGMLDPDDHAIRQMVRKNLGVPVEAARLNRFEVHKALEHGYGTFPPDAYVLELDKPRMDGDGATPAEFLEQVLKDAVTIGASDVHLEQYLEDVDVRLRIDGILHQQFTHIDPDIASEVIGRIKVISGLDITEHRRPQDGRFRATLAGGERDMDHVDFRVSLVPGPAGEDAVIRILDAETGLVDVDALGMAPEVLETFLRLVNNPEGMMMVTGPTGSGKTTTLYAAINHINDGTRKIVTAEDPIEYYIEKINQKQVSPQMSMGDLLRALLRQDPDIMLFGEVRDHETGETAVRASSTGHLVLGTLHTSDALGAVDRLRGLELDDGDIASGLLGVLAQRLVRRICRHCSALGEISDAHHRLFGPLLHQLAPRAGRGCHRCHDTGYLGRTGIFELVVVNEDLQEMIAEGAPRSDMLEYLARSSFRSMLEDGLHKVRSGITTLDELARVVPYRQIAHARQEAAEAAALTTSLEPVPG